MVNWSFYDAKDSTRKLRIEEYERNILENKTQSQKYNNSLNVLFYLTLGFVTIFLLNMMLSGQTGVVVMILNTFIYAGIINALLYLTTLYERKNIGYGKQKTTLTKNIVYVIGGVINVAYLICCLLFAHIWKLPAADNIVFELFRIILFLIAWPVLTWLFIKHRLVGSAFVLVAIMAFGISIFPLVSTSKKVNMNSGTTFMHNKKIINPQYFDKKNRGVLLLSCDTNSFISIFYEITMNGKTYEAYTDKENPFTAIVLPEGSGTLQLTMELKEFTKGRRRYLCDCFPVDYQSEKYIHMPKTGAFNTITGFKRTYICYQLPVPIDISIDANKLNYAGYFSTTVYTPVITESKHFFVLRCPCNDDKLLKIINAWGSRAVVYN